MSLLELYWLDSNRIRQLNLSGGLDRFPDAKVDDDPGQEQEPEKFPTDAAEVLDVGGHLQHSVAVA